MGNVKEGGGFAGGGGRAGDTIFKQTGDSRQIKQIIQKANEADGFSGLARLDVWFLLCFLLASTLRPLQKGSSLFF